MRRHVVGAIVLLLLVCAGVVVGLAAGSTADSAGGGFADQATTVGFGEPATVGLGESTVGHAAEPTLVGSSQQIEMTTTLDRTPDRTGEITATVSVVFPDSVTEFTARLPEGVRVTETDGFSEVDETDYEWDGRTDDPQVTFRFDADERVDQDGPLAEDGELLFTETDEWAIVRIPSTGASWRYTGGGEMSLDRSTEIDGPGVVGERMAFLGEHEEKTHTAHDQRFRLIIPDEARLAESPERIFESLDHASDELRVGERDDEVFMIAAPTDGVEWAVSGLQGGSSDMWVGDIERVDTPTNVWVHEYVHTRQGYETTDETEWFTEASATYYAALLTLQEGHISFDEFQRYLADGENEPQSSAVLSDPGSWENNADYRKGPLVAGEIDRQIRLATDSQSSFAAVFRSLNSHDGELSAAEFERYVAAAATDEVADQANTYTTTDSTPTMWDSDQHASAFGQAPARFTFELAATDPLTASGPDGSTTLSASNATITAGQTVTVNMTVTNIGGTVGSYELPFAVGNHSTTESGRLGPDEAANHEFSHTFDEPGTYSIDAGGERIDLTVEPREAASADVPVDVEVPGFGIPSVVVAVALSVMLLARRASRR